MHNAQESLIKQVNESPSIARLTEQAWKIKEIEDTQREKPPSIDKGSLIIKNKGAKR